MHKIIAYQQKKQTIVFGYRTIKMTSTPLDAGRSAGIYKLNTVNHLIAHFDTDHNPISFKATQTLGLLASSNALKTPEGQLTIRHYRPGLSMRHLVYHTTPTNAIQQKTATIKQSIQQLNATQRQTCLWKFFDQIINQLTPLWAAGIALNDITPSNILLDWDGQQVWLVDTGNATKINDDCSVYEVTSPGFYTTTQLRQSPTPKSDATAALISLTKVLYPPSIQRSYFTSIRVRNSENIVNNYLCIHWPTFLVTLCNIDQQLADQIKQKFQIILNVSTPNIAYFNYALPVRRITDIALIQHILNRNNLVQYTTIHPYFSDQYVHIKSSKNIDHIIKILSDKLPPATQSALNHSHPQQTGCCSIQ
ncbi:MAG: hypothetical protein ACON35_08430 [Candidatus Marinamargulisbacteria bacterium]